MFLNLDGTVHPVITQLKFFHGLPHVGPIPFCWSESLRPLIEEWDATIVLRSSATQNYGVEAVKEVAPAWLRDRIAGSASDTLRFISYLEARRVNTSFGVIDRYVKEHDLLHWVAVDDKDDGWPADSSVRRHLVQCDPTRGVSDPAVVAKLDAALRAFNP